MKRLRDPRQALAFLAGIAYVFFFFLRPFLMGTIRTPTSYPGGMLNLGRYAPLVQVVVALALAVIVLVTWITASSRPAFRLSEAEIHLLLPAPLTRRQVLDYALLKQQVGILTGSLILFVFTALRGARSPWAALPRLFAYWGFLTLLDLHMKGVSLWKARQTELPAAARRRRLAWAVLIGAAWCAAIAWGLWRAWQTVQSGPGWVATDFRGIAGIALGLAQAVRGGLAGAALAPFLWLAAPIAATGLARLGGGLFFVLLLVLHYEWVVRSSARFEEAALARARRRVRRGWRRGNWEGLSRLARSRSPFRLEAARAPELAITWKNLLLRGRMPLRRGAGLTLLALACLALALAAAGVLGIPPIVDGMVAGIGFGLMLVMPLVAGNFLRNDLHVDFQHLEMLRAWPISGWRLVAAEILAPAVALLWIELMAAGVVAAAALAAAVSGAAARHAVLDPIPQALLGGASSASAFGAALAAALGGLAIVALAVGLFSIALQNLAILLFPGWVPLGYAVPRGTSMFGQNLVVGLGRLLGLALGSIAPLLAGGLLYALLNLALGLRFTPWELPVLAVAVALLYLVEVFLMIRTAGAIWDRLDPSQEILDPVA